MKKLLLLSLFIFPAAIVSFGQRFDVSEQGGVSTTVNGYQKNGFANQVAIGYHPIKHLAVSAFYETNKWTSTNNASGLSVDFISKYFFAGIEYKMTWSKPFNIDEGDITYNYSRWAYGLHAGAKQKIYKRLSLVEQAGYVMLGVATSGTLNVLPIGSTSSSEEYRMQDITLYYFYTRVGLSYRL